MNIDGQNLNAFVLYWSVNIYEKKRHLVSENGE